MAHGAGQGVPHTPGLVSATDSWRLLRAHAEEPGEVPHLRQLMADTKRCEKMFTSHDGITLDYSRQVRSQAKRGRGRRTGGKGHTAFVVRSCH
jgi:hypothetical protein